MKLSILLVAVLLGSATAGVTTYLLVDASPSSPRNAPAPLVAARPAPDAELAARVDQLVAENAELSMRLATLEDRPLPEQRAPIDGYVSRSDFEAFQKEMRAALGGRAVAVTESGDFEEQIKGALIDIRKQEQFDKVRQSQEKRAARLDEDVQKVSEWLQLSGYQTEEMRTALEAQYEREDEVRRLWEAGESDEVLGEHKRSAGEQFRQDTERIFTPEQFQTFWERFGGGGKG